MTGCKSQRYVTHRIKDTIEIDGFKFSNAFDRDNFYRTSIQIPGRDFVVQGSNILNPDETTEDDWVDITASVNTYTTFDHLCKWVRVKGTIEPGDAMYILSLTNPIS